MKRKVYQEPTMKVIQLSHQSNILVSSFETTGTGKTSINAMENDAFL